MIVLGTVIQLKYRQYINIFGDELLSAPIIIIITGVVCLSLSFFGCCGAIRENYCMTMTVGVQAVFITSKESVLDVMNMITGFRNKILFSLLSYSRSY
jgi:CD63 antigen